jgi:calcium permeable stress-gated cation channel
MEKWISKFVVFVASILLILAFLLVVGFVQGLAYLQEHTGNVGFLHRFVSIFSVILFSHHLKYLS